jgi:hypothetical protein
MPAETYSMSGLRIRAPHKHDVLSGRGGGINMHPGNKVFREWVADRKEEYNLAPNKHEKTRIAMEVIERVTAQNPPGRFLIRDPTSGSSQSWWVEVDEARALAKTSQALREGAPQIRLAHREELLERANHTKQRRSTAGTKRKRKPAQQQQPQHVTTTSPTFPSMPPRQPIQRMSTDDYNRAMESLQSNVREAKDLADQEDHCHHEQQYWDPNTKKLRFEMPHVSPGNNNDDTDEDTNKLLDSMPETPSLLSLPNPPNSSETYMEDLNLGSPVQNSNSGRRDAFQQAINTPAPSFRNMPRVHSLALSDFSMSDTNGVFDDDGEFVNPFEDESGIAGKVMRSRHEGSNDNPKDRLISSAEYLRNLSSTEDNHTEPHHVEPCHSDEKNER